MSKERYIIQISVCRLNPDDGGPLEPTPVQEWRSAYSDKNLTDITEKAQNYMNAINATFKFLTLVVPQSVQPIKENNHV